MARIAVVGHVEHLTLGLAPEVPKAGEIAHLTSAVSFGGGGGGVTFHQLVKSDAEVLLFTAFGSDEGARFVEDQARRTGARVFAAARTAPQTRDVAIVTPDGERTIIVIGEPLHPTAADPLPWEELAACDAVYFTARDPKLLPLCRRARILIVSARRRPALDEARVYADVVVGSAHDPRESSTLADFAIAPRALVMTEGKDGGRVDTAAGSQRFQAVPVPRVTGGAYGAGDSFAGALVYYLAIGLDARAAAARAAVYGAAVLSKLSPLEGQVVLAPQGSGPGAG